MHNQRSGGEGVYQLTWVLVLVVLSSPVVVRVVVIVGAHRYPWVVGTRGLSLFFGFGCGKRLPSLVKGDDCGASS